MAKPLVKINIELSQIGFKVTEKDGKTFVFAEVSDEIVIDEDKKPIVKLVGWELPNKKGAAPLKIDYEKDKKYEGSEQYPPTLGWCNVQLGSSENAAPVPNNAPDPIEADDLPF